MSPTCWRVVAAATAEVSEWSRSRWQKLPQKRQQRDSNFQQGRWLSINIGFERQRAAAKSEQHTNVISSSIGCGYDNEHLHGLRTRISGTAPASLLPPPAAASAAATTTSTTRATITTARLSGDLDLHTASFDGESRARQMSQAKATIASNVDDDDSSHQDQDLNQLDTTTTLINKTFQVANEQSPRSKSFVHISKTFQCPSTILVLLVGLLCLAAGGSLSSVRGSSHAKYQHITLGQHLRQLDALQQREQQHQQAQRHTIYQQQALLSVQDYPDRIDNRQQQQQQQLKADTSVGHQSQEYSDNSSSNSNNNNNNNNNNNSNDNINHNNRLRPSLAAHANAPDTKQWAASDSHLIADNNGQTRLAPPGERWPTSSAGYGVVETPSEPDTAASQQIRFGSTTPSLNRQVGAPLYEFSLMPTSAVQLESLHENEGNTNRKPSMVNGATRTSTTSFRAPFDGAYVHSGAQLAAESLVRPVLAAAPNGLDHFGSLPAENVSSGAALVFGGGGGQSARAERQLPYSLNVLNSAVDQAQQANQEQQQARDASQSSHTTPKTMADSFGAQQDDTAEKGTNNGIEQQQQAIDKGIEPRQRRRLFNRILKKAEWNHLFVELSKVFLRYFLDLALKDIIGKQSGSSSFASAAGSSGSDSSGSTSGRKKLDAQSELADLLRDFIKTAISNI